MEYPMTIKTKIAALAVAALAATGSIASTTKAEAHGFRFRACVLRTHPGMTMWIEGATPP